MATIKLPNSDQFDTMNAHLANIVSTATSAIGNRTYTEDNYVTDSETVTASIDALDIQVKDNTDAITAMLGIVYPIGCVYTSVVSTSPATLFGLGTWAALGAGRVLVGIDSGDTDFDAAEETGGAKTHTLTETEMPNHNHQQYVSANFGSGGSAVYTDMNSEGIGASAYPQNVATGTAGSGQAHNNMPPYITVYRWKRTA